MNTLLILLFVVTYAAIAFEHPIKINKSASALLGAGLMWAVYAVMSNDSHAINHELSETLISTAQIVFFLMGAMTIVEVVDAHKGFDVVTSRIKTTQLATLLWVVGCVTFFLSAILDNLTTTIVMVSLMKKLLHKREDRLLFAGLIVIAANAGGAWSPIGDVTTTMLWIGGQITAMSIIQSLILPSIVNLLVPLVICAWMLRGQLVEPPHHAEGEHHGTHTSVFERNIMFFLGLGVLVAVPAFKTITHLPPFMGVLLGLGLLWLVGDILHKGKSAEERSQLELSHALSRIDMSSIVFFIGILLAVATLEHTHILTGLAQWLDQTVGRQDVIVMLIGVFSAIVDNVPLVAASMGMYSLDVHATDSFLWTFLAYCAGTGGSILIIGSAAGVAAMGIEKIDFVWYFKKISGLAVVGYLAGAAVYILQYNWMH
ncbi:MAG: sodium:proton antiporter [Burkholderiales bacterium 35-55-47]|uniref:sodium:proton antiporter NhaD n=1 Tax=Limnohabitans sp. TaxID=1907725 RepID=UPI000BD7A539|nr:sodium:proton antiporter NhaD [Limnohabitans sp.]OYY20075.1 MAG: sodium:proton antiporter [Burkholderiales bacterium 35-55-47]OYZ74315.1 MAG: sodium:proton antiporter [Burkholderiales bacterium 24-55-52]OZB01794.1 MAG: sodium:proton antiporter [Burkholderiales bacterium 39-55-53]HQR86305.1 sodium:proton antiporter NhaD [Limnohabitans sp.]HQS25778.1 sodium:proton antiporter NhaD [Limnohabitans sp.]